MGRRLQRAKFRCPCCDYMSLHSRADYSICKVCFWEDDGTYFNKMDEPSGANGLTLRQARANFLRVGACEERFVDNVIEPAERASLLYRPRGEAALRQRSREMVPPDQIDQADVLEYAWSYKPFGEVRYPDGTLADVIHGFAICRYAGSETIYRFSCNKDWEAVQDFDYGSIEEAREQLPEQYRNAPVYWQRR